MAAQTMSAILDRFKTVLEAPPLNLVASTNPFDDADVPATLVDMTYRLVSAGLVRDRKLAAWPGIQDDIRNAGGTWLDEPLVRDGNWLSSRSPLDLLQFERGMIELFEEAPRRVLRRVRRRRFAHYRSRSALAFLLGVGLEVALRRRLLTA